MRYRQVLLLAIGLCFFIRATSQTTAAHTLDRESVPWSRIDYRARKLLLGAEASITLSRGAKDLAIDLDSHFLNRDWQARLFLDPRTGATALFERIDRRGGRTAAKRVRFDPCGTVTWRREGRPVLAESPVPLDHFWLGADRLEESFPDDYCSASSPAGLGVLDPSSLLYAISASDLGQGGERSLRWPVLMDGTPVAVVATPLGLETVSVDFNQYQEDGSLEIRKEQARVLHLRLSGEPWLPTQSDEQIDVDIELLGLRGSLLDVYLDPESRVPVEIRGRVAGLGSVRVRAKDVWFGPGELPLGEGR